MLLKEFLKEHQRVHQLQWSDAEQKKEIAELKRQLREQVEAIRNVTDRIELGASTSRRIVHEP